MLWMHHEQVEPVKHVLSSCLVSPLMSFNDEPVDNYKVSGAALPSYVM